jgi:hypothetical protein
MSDFQDVPVEETVPAPKYKTELYEGNPMIVLSRKPDDKFPMRFGLSKAKLILANIDAIKAFVEHEEKIRAANPNKSYKKSFRTPPPSKEGE